MYNTFYTISYLRIFQTIPILYTHKYIYILYIQKRRYWWTFVAICQRRYFIADTHVHRWKTLNDSYWLATSCLVQRHKAVGKDHRRLAVSFTTWRSWFIVIILSDHTLYIRQPNYTRLQYYTSFCAPNTKRRVTTNTIVFRNICLREYSLVEILQV